MNREIIINYNFSLQHEHLRDFPFVLYGRNQYDMLQRHSGGYIWPQYHCTQGCTPIDLKYDTVAEHPCRPLCSVSLILFTQLVDFFHRP